MAHPCKWIIHVSYGVATISRLLKIEGVCGKRDLQKRLYSAKETHNFKEPTHRSHPIWMACKFKIIGAYWHVPTRIHAHIYYTSIIQKTRSNAHVHTHIFIIRKHKHTCTYTHMYVKSVYICIYMYVYTYIHEHICIYKHSYIYSINTYTYLFTYIYAHM